MTSNRFLPAQYSDSWPEQRNAMKTYVPNMSDPLITCMKERKLAANELQNEVNQTLAAALLWIRFAKMEHRLHGDPSIQNAENIIQEAIERIRVLHYSLVQDIV